jgi:uncharacterized Ntn-hydrolase superfamily protein
VSRLKRRLAIAACALAASNAAAQTIPAADGVPVDAFGHPHYATFSICAIDPSTGESGVAVTTRVPFVGRAVPWVKAGVGAVATQASTVVDYGRKGLELLEQGVPPQEAIARLLADDRAPELRQLGLIDMKGRAAAHTGEKNGAWAGSRQGRHYTVQGNILVGREVIDAVADEFESGEGVGMPLAERLILALRAGQQKGGDRRWGQFQSAALRVADPNEPGRAGDHVSVAIDVGEHPQPVAELERIYRTTAQRLGWRSFSEIRGRDVVELKRMLHALGYWRRELHAFPAEPNRRIDPALRRTDPERARKLAEEQQGAFQKYMEEFGTYDASARDAVDAFRKGRKLDYQGNPSGLVDDRLIEALREAYHAKLRGAQSH